MYSMYQLLDYYMYVIMYNLCLLSGDSSEMGVVVVVVVVVGVVSVPTFHNICIIIVCACKMNAKMLGGVDYSQ